MASLSRDKDGVRIQFMGADGKRHAIRLGQVPRKSAEVVLRMVEHLAHAAMTNAPPPGDVSAWVGALIPRMRQKLDRVGLLGGFGATETRLGPFLDDYIDSRKDIGDSTEYMLRATRGSLVTFFGADRLLSAMSEGDAELWYRSLLAERKSNGEPLSDNTIRRRCGRAKQFFRFAIKKRHITANPFADLKGSVRAVKSKQFFVTRDVTARLLKACPNWEWRLIVGLARYGGLRMPSEAEGLRLTDVNWETGRMLIRSPKTKHHPGHESREIPIFPELRPLLLDAFENAKTGAKLLVPSLTDHAVNTGRQITRIMLRAGIEPWAKPFQNMRSTRETELADEWAAHVVCAWIGNSEVVAQEHYLQVRPEHFEKAAQIPAQQEPDSTGNNRNVRTTNSKNKPKNTVFPDENVAVNEVPSGQGHPHISREITPILDDRLKFRRKSLCDDLLFLVDNWDELDDAVKRRILGIARRATP